MLEVPGVYSPSCTKEQYSAVVLRLIITDAGAQSLSIMTEIDSGETALVSHRRNHTKIFAVI